MSATIEPVDTAASESGRWPGWRQLRTLVPYLQPTLAALIARLWESPPGTLLLDGRPILEYPLDELRRAIG